jgi:hypothetical protein
VCVCVCVCVCVRARSVKALKAASGGGEEEDKKKSKPKGKKASTGEPKRAKSAYQYFMPEERERLKKAGDKTPSAELNKKIGAMLFCRALHLASDQLCALHVSG